MSKSTIRSAKNDIKRAVYKSMNLIEGDFMEYTKYRENYEYLIQLPLFRDLILENRQLKKDNNKLLDILLHADEPDISSTVPIPAPFPISKPRRQKLYKSSSVIVKEENDVEYVGEATRLETISDDVNIVYLLEESSEVGHEPPVQEQEPASDEGGQEDEEEEEEEKEEEDEEDEEVEVEDEEDEEVEEEEEEEEEEEDEEVEVEDEEDEEVEEEEDEEEEEEDEEEEEEDEEEEEEEVEDEEVEVEDEEVEEEEEEEEVEVEEVEVEDEEVEVEEEEEVFEIEVNGITYYTTNRDNGVIYGVDDEGDVGESVGKFTKGVAIMNV